MCLDTLFHILPQQNISLLFFETLKKGSTKISCFLLILSYTVTSRENVYHIFRTLGEPKPLKPSQLIAAWAAVLVGDFVSSDVHIIPAPIMNFWESFMKIKGSLFCT